MSSKYEHTPPLNKPWKAKEPVRYETCQRMHYDFKTKRIALCGADTRGHPYCDACLKASMIAGPKFHGGLRTNRSEAA